MTRQKRRLLEATAKRKTSGKEKKEFSLKEYESEKFGKVVVWKEVSKVVVNAKCLEKGRREAETVKADEAAHQNKLFQLFSIKILEGKR